MIALYREWCESEGVAFNEEHFCESLILSFSEGSLIPLVLWNGDEPVGVVMANVYRELFTGELTAMGGQLYLKPAYRGNTEGAKLGVQLIHLIEWFGVKNIRMPSKPELANYYWRHFPPGFKLSTLVFSATKE